MPQYPNLVIDANLSISKLGQLSNARLQNVTSAGRLTLEQELVASELLGNDHNGQVVFDVNEGQLYVFVSANSQFERISNDIQGDVIYRGDINPTLTSQSTSTSGPIQAKKGNQYIANAAGDLVMSGVTFYPDNKVQIGDAVIFWDASTAWIFQSNTGPATTEQAGTIDIATQQTVDDGLSDSEAVTPATLAGSQLAADIAANVAPHQANAADILSLQGFTGEGTPLSIGADLAEAINLLVARADSASGEVDAIESFVGEGTSLDTLATNIAGAINELVVSDNALVARITAEELNLSSLQTYTGEGTALSTIATTIANAINELHGEINVNTTDVASNTADIATNTAAVLFNTNETAANRQEILALLTRVDSVDTTFSGLDSDIASLYAQIAANDSDIASAFEQIGNSGNDSDIASLVARLTTAETNIVSNDNDIASLATRMLTAEGNIVTNDSDILANAGSITSLQAYTGEGTVLNTTANNLAEALNELHGRNDSANGPITANDSDILSLQGFLGTPGSLQTSAQTLAEAVNELKNDVDGNDSDLAILTDIVYSRETHAEIKAFNQDGINLLADVEFVITHNLSLPFIAGFTMGVMDGSGDLLSVEARAIDANTVGITSEVDASNASFFMLANITEMDETGSSPEGIVGRADGISVPDDTLASQEGELMITQDGIYIVLNNPTTGGGADSESTDSLAPAPEPEPEPEPEPNDPPVISGIDASYTLTQGQDTVITGVATDPEGDTVTWSYAVTAGDLSGTTVSQSDNVFTVTPGTADATFQLTFTATDVNGNASTHVSDFTYDYVEPTNYWNATQVSDWYMFGSSTVSEPTDGTFRFTRIAGNGNVGQYTVTGLTGGASYVISATGDTSQNDHVAEFTLQNANWDDIDGPGPLEWGEGGTLDWAAGATSDTQSVTFTMPAGETSLTVRVRLAYTQPYPSNTAVWDFSDIKINDA